MLQLIMAIFRLLSIIQGGRIFFMCVGLIGSEWDASYNLILCEGTSRNVAVQVLIIKLLRNIYKMSA